jgi:ribosomal protein S27E
MIALTCWGCGWEGQVPDHFAGLNVSCKRCGAATVVPHAHAEEVYEHDSIEEIDLAILEARTEGTILSSVCDEPLSASWPYL